MRISVTNPGALTSASRSVKWSQGGGIDEQKTTTVSGSSSVTNTPYIPNDDVVSDYLTGMSYRSSVSNLADESLTTLTTQLGRFERAVHRLRWSRCCAFTSCSSDLRERSGKGRRAWCIRCAARPSQSADGTPSAWEMGAKRAKNSDKRHAQL